MKRTLSLLMAVLMLTAVVLTGCTSGGTTSGAASSSDASSASSEAESESSAAEENDLLAQIKRPARADQGKGHHHGRDGRHLGAVDIPRYR